MTNLPTVVIVGRPNVGKSSLLNRIVGSPHAIVDPTPGVTRDRNYAQTSWNGRYFQIIDTGGLDPDQTTPVQEAINNQVDFALHEAEAIIFVCDFRDGLVHDDKTIFNLLRKKCGSKQVFICINKIDNTNIPDPINEFYTLGAKRFFPVSSLHGHGIADLLDEIVKPWPRMDEPDEKTLRSERIAIIGKPNVGKSALMNKLLGAERTIVDDTPGTTRDAITVSIEHNGKTYRFIDTAGLRRPARKKASVELNSVYRTLNAIDRSDISILVLDASEMAITEQDKRIASRILEAGSACIIVWNKWDIVSDRAASWDELLKKTRFELNLMEFAPVISCSAKTGLRTDRLFEMIDQVRESKNADIPEARLSEILHESMIIQPPPTYKGRPLRIKGLRRLKQSGVTFIVNCSEPGGLHFSYRRYLLNQIRHENSFEGWPVRLLVRKIESEGN